MYVCIYVHVSTYITVRMYVCVYVSICYCMSIRIYVYVYVRVCMYIYVTYMALSESVISTCMCLYLEALSGYLDLLCLNRFYNWPNHLQTHSTSNYTFQLNGNTFIHSIVLTMRSTCTYIHTYIHTYTVLY